MILKYPKLGAQIAANITSKGYLSLVAGPKIGSNVVVTMQSPSKL